MQPARFSANSEGACPRCHGAGLIYTDLAIAHPLDGHPAGVATVCEECGGKRFPAEPGKPSRPDPAATKEHPSYTTSMDLTPWLSAAVSTS